MTSQGKAVSVPSDFDVEAYRKAVALDLRLFAFLHGQEIDEKAFQELKSHPFGYRMALEPPGKIAREALGVIDGGWKILEAESLQKALDDLGADYASIYLTYKLRASPSESVWFDDDHLMRQGPMFDIRGWYERYNLKTRDWSRRSDDHLSLQLEFIAHLVDDPKVGLEEPARFMDEHLLRWIGEFAARVSTRCATPFYAGLAPLTACYVEGLRDVIEATTGYVRPVEQAEPDTDTSNQTSQVQPDILS